MILTFPTFNSLAAINVNGHVYGYMHHEKGVTRMHLGVTSPWWLVEVRRQGPFAGHAACQDAIRNAARQ